MTKKNILVTGGAGFIGSSFVDIATNKYHKIIVIDKLTYSGNINNLSWIDGFDTQNQFYKADIADKELISKILTAHKIDWVVNFAAESHVDNSINNPSPFIETNIVGTYNLLEASKNYFLDLEGTKKEGFRFLHISTDEVFGELGETGKFSENSIYEPSSPYSASKAASDHLVRAWHRTFNLPILITNCSNNYGPRQHNEKLIPTIISKALNEQEIPIYGDGKNVRDWIFVDDHNLAVLKILESGKIGETYCIGVNNEKNNNEIVNIICSKLDQIKPRNNGQTYNKLIKYVADRAGHDRRYAIDSSKIEKELNFSASILFEDAITKTINYYLNNKS
jgi:dTDP-glucose 4,6-dehydratase